MWLFGKCKENELEATEVATVATKNRVFARLKSGLKRTREQMLAQVGALFLGKKVIDQEILEELETHLLLADVGVAVVQEVIQELTARVSRKELTDVNALMTILKQQLTAILLPCNKPLSLPDTIKPYVILVVGVNGAGKTTTIGKITKQLQAAGKSIMLAAGDTFRAAAIEQLQIWGERNRVPVIAQNSGADSAAVIHDALQAAKARKFDVLIADTAGRLHTQHNLMAELKKVQRVIAKLDSSAPHEVLLVLDAGIGQNALMQAKQFHAAVNVTGIVLTKLDGTAKGGIIFAIAQALKIPIRFIGIGEQVDDLRAFDAKEFVEALFNMHHA